MKIGIGVKRSLAVCGEVIKLNHVQLKIFFAISQDANVNAALKTIGGIL